MLHDVVEIPKNRKKFKLFAEKRLTAFRLNRHRNQLLAKFCEQTQTPTRQRQNVLKLVMFHHHSRE